MATPISDRQPPGQFGPLAGKMLVAGRNGVSSSAGVQMIGPRLNHALIGYKLFGSDKTAIRAGYAIFHDLPGARVLRVFGAEPAIRRGIVWHRFRRPSPIPLSVPSPPPLMRRQLGQNLPSDLALPIRSRIGFSDVSPIMPTARAHRLISNFSNLIAKNLSLGRERFSNLT